MRRDDVAEVVRPGVAADPELFLPLLADRSRPALDARGICVVVAHPDDETLGCGAQLPRLADVTVVVVTDGAPADLVDAHASGCANATEYAALRDRELRDALSLARVPGSSVVRLGFRDQTAARHLSAIARRLADLFADRGIRLALTHAYEGGHPDHDATAFAVHAAAALLRRRGHRLAIVEMPLYYATPCGFVVQRFTSSPECPEFAVPLTAREQALKQRMIAAHASQSRTLALFGAEVERFRRAPTHDFTVAPRPNAMWYRGNSWGLTGDGWLSLADEATRELDLGRA